MGYYVRAEPGVNLYVEDLNPEGKQTVFLVHGWPGDHTLFEYQLNTLPKLGYRCVAIDCRGFGRSDRPWGGYGYDRLADDVRAVIDTLKLQNIVLCGHSTGGAVCIRYMARHGGCGVAKLALFAAAAPSLIRRPDFPYGIREQDVRNIISETGRDRPRMLKDFGTTIFFHRVGAGIQDWIFQLGLQAANWSTSAVAETWIRETLFGDLPKIDVPTLILHGLDDRVCLYPLAIAQNKAIRGSRLVPLRQCGHFLFYDQRELFNRELTAFLQNG